MKKKDDNAEIITIAGSVICFLAFTLLVNGISTGYFVDMQNLITGMVMIQTAGMSPAQALSTVIGSFAAVIAAVIFLTLGFAILSAYGAYAGDKKVGLIAGVISGAIMLLVFHFTITAFLMLITMAIVCMYIVPLSNTYFQELVKWKFFRTGAHAVSKALFVFNIMLALGIFLTVTQNLGAYGKTFTEGFSAVITDAVMDEKAIEKAVEENYPGLPEAQKRAAIEAMKAQASETVDKTMAQSPIFRSYVTWLPLVVAGTVWVTLEFLRSLLFGNLAGIFSSLLIRVYEKIM